MIESSTIDKERAYLFEHGIRPFDLVLSLKGQFVGYQYSTTSSLRLVRLFDNASYTKRGIQVIHTIETDAYTGSGVIRSLYDIVNLCSGFAIRRLTEEEIGALSFFTDEEEERIKASSSVGQCAYCAVHGVIETGCWKIQGIS